MPDVANEQAAALALALREACDRAAAGGAWVTLAEYLDTRGGQPTGRRKLVVDVGPQGEQPPCGS